jgi:hypothetical protein
MVLRTQMYRSVIHYYVALKLSAGAVAPMFGPQFENPPTPIVRRYVHADGTQWDPRETVSVGTRRGIVTLPCGDRRAFPAAFIGNN